MAIAVAREPIKKPEEEPHRYDVTVALKRISISSGALEDAPEKRICSPGILKSIAVEILF